jgi:hypothetical protein
MRMVSLNTWVFSLFLYTFPEKLVLKLPDNHLWLFGIPMWIFQLLVVRVLAPSDKKEESYSVTIVWLLSKNINSFLQLICMNGDNNWKSDKIYADIKMFNLERVLHNNTFYFPITTLIFKKTCPYNDWRFRFQENIVLRTKELFFSKAFSFYTFISNN